MKCAFLQGDLDEQRVDDDDDDDTIKIKSAQPVSDTFCEPVPECSVHVDDFMLACGDSPFGNTSLRALTICTSGERGSHESNSVAHKSLKPAICTLEHEVDSRSASQNT